MEQEQITLLDARSDQIGELAKSLCQAQLQFPAIKKDCVNPYFKSKYADLNTIIQAVKKPLADNGLAILQLTIPDSELAKIKTLLIHISGQYIASEIALKPTKSDPQGIGSALTYARRYSLSAMLNISSEEDDDGNTASKEIKIKPEEVKTDKSNPVNPYDQLKQAKSLDEVKQIWSNNKKLQTIKFFITAKEQAKIRLSEEIKIDDIIPEQPKKAKKTFYDTYKNNLEAVTDLKILDITFNDIKKKPEYKALTESQQFDLQEVHDKTAQKLRDAIILPF